MKKYLAMLLVFALLAGSLFCFAEDLEPEEMEIVIADDETGVGDEQEAVAEAEGLLLDAASGQEGEKTKGDDGETILAFEVDEEQGSADLEEEDTEAERCLASNGSTDVRVGDFTYNFDDGGGKIVKYNGNAKNLDIESTVDYNGVTYKVVRIGESAFEKNTVLESVTLPDSIISIGSSAFSGCTHLTRLTINSDLADCTDNVYRSFYRPFYNTGTYANSFTVTFGANVTKIPAHIFNTGSSKSDATYAHVTKIIINDGVTAIGDCAFRNCYDLTSVEWGKGLLDIGNDAFASDTGLTEIELPAKTYSIGENVFSGCTFLKTVTLPASLNSIGSSAFSNCTHLTRLTINSDLADCTDNVYRSCYHPFYNTGTYVDSLTVTFGGGVTKIPAHLFNTGCSKESGEYCHVSAVNLPASVKKIGTGAFHCCHDLTNIKFGGSQIDWNQISIGEDNNYITGATISYGTSGVAVTGVTLNQTTLSLSEGATAILTAAIEPTSATDKGVAWTSDNEDVATVSDGRVTAVGVGRATVTATSTSNPKKSASCEVTVTESTIAVTGVTISQSTLSLNVGGTATLTASVQPSGTAQGVVWSSDDTAVATVSASGVVKAVATGKATITATSVSDSSRKATCAVTVSSGAILATSIALDREELTLRVGESATLTRTILPEHITTKKGNYQVSDKSVFIVEGSSISGNTCVYTLRGVGVGTAKLTVKTKDGTNLSATCAVTVLPDIPEKDLVRTGSNGTVKINKGEKLQLVASFATKKGWKIKSVSSNNKKVAAVDSAGLVTAKKAGTATITVKTSNKKKATVKIEVVDPTVPTKVVLNKTGTVKLKKGKTLQLTATVYPDTAETTLKWSSSSKKLATVTSDGLVKAKKKGTATITVKTGNGKKAKVKIKIV